MAEILGVVSAGFSIASFTIQIAEKTNKIRHFLNDVKSAPAEIQMYLQDIQLLTEILQDFDTQRSGSFGNQRSRQCAERCRQAANLTSDFLNDIQKIVAKRRKRGSIEFAFKRDDLERLLRRLENIKTTLHLAHMISQMQHQVFMSEWAEYQNKIMQNLTAQVSSNVEVTSCSAETSSSSSSSKPIALTKSQHRTSRRPTFRIELPIWMGGKVWEIYTSRAQVEWAFRLRTYNIIPHDSLICRLAEDGDMDGLADLLRSNQASVFDCNPRGETALHLSARKGQVAACQFLLDRGADPCAMDRDLRTPLQSALFIGRIRGRWYGGGIFRRNYLEPCISKLIPVTQDAILDRGESFLMANGVEPLRQVLEFIYPPFYERPLSERITLCKESPYLRWRAKMIPLILTIEERENISIYRQQILPVAVRQCTRAALTLQGELNDYIALLGSILSGYYSRQLAKCQINGQSRGLIMPFLRQSLNCSPAGCPYQKLQGYWPSLSLLRTKPPSLIQILARSLQAANINLLQIGKLESQILAQNWIDKDIPARTWLRRNRRRPGAAMRGVTVRLIGFSYGAKPEEWHCWVSNFRDEYAGEFWDMVANTEPGIDMPGSWVD